MGDLISRKAVLEALRARGRQLQNLSVTSFEKAISLGVAHECVGIVKEAPAVDAEPVRHERWELVDEEEFADGDIKIEEKCSGCGRYVYRYSTQPKDEYCPTCGAKMDKEE